MHPERIGDHVVHPSIPAMFQAKARDLAPMALMFNKEKGTWRARTLQDVAQKVQRWTLGLLALGIVKGDRVGIVSDTRVEWSLADQAVLHAGGVTVGVYPSLLADDVAYQLAHSEAKVVFVENAGQLAKLQSVRSKVPAVQAIVVFDKEGAELDYTTVIDLSDLESRGDSYETVHPEAFEASWKAVGPDDLATIIYTSGTTGNPKGALLSHGNLTFVVASASAAIASHGPGDFGVAFLPLAHALQRVGGYIALYNGVPGAFAESVEKFLDNLRELRPTVQVSVPRMWEKIYSRIQGGLPSAPWHRRKLFEWALAQGRASAPYRKRGQPVPGLLGLKWSIAKRFFRSKVWPRLGLERVRFLTSGGAPIGVELLEFFYAMDVLILEAWGLTETAAPATVNRLGDFEFGTVGKAIPGVEVKVAEDGELLVRGPGVFKGYYKDEEATRAAFDESGFFRTGDIGTVDERGFVRITDRKKNIIVLSAGKKVPPQNLENVFRESPFLGPCLIHGDRRNFLSAVFTLDPEEIVPWARTQGILPPANGKAEKVDELAKHLPELAKHERVQKLVADVVASTNARLAKYEQVKRWAITGDRWTVENGALTPTLKVKRKVLEERYRPVLEGFYEGEGAA